MTRVQVYGKTKFKKKKITEFNINDLDKDLSMEEYKSLIIDYGKISEYPDINKSYE